MKNLKTYLFFFLFGMVHTVNAQGDPNNTPSGFSFDGVISGLVLDSVTQQPVEYAAVSAMAVRDSSIAGGMVTDEKGVFKIDKLKPGRYILRIKFIGYKETIIPGIVLKPGEATKHFDKILLAPAAQNLGEVEITHYTEVMEANLDKRVINVEKDLTSVGGTALDVMKNVPSVQVDMDNNISLRGNNNVRILIDGRLTTLDPTTMLLQIPASMVSKVEVITNPSAKYDPDGVSGIINIITKKERKPGFNGIVTAGVGTGSKTPAGGMENFDLNKYNFTTSMNYQTGKFNFFGSYDGRYGVRYNRGRTYRELYVSDTFTDILDQYSGKMRPSWNHNGKLGADVTFNEHNIFSLSGNVRDERGSPYETIEYFQYDGEGNFLNQFERNSNEENHEFSYDANMNFKHTFKEKGHELIFDATYSNTKNNKNNKIYESYFNENGEVYSTDSIYDNILEEIDRQLITAQLDYVNPTEKYGRFETGLKYQGRVNGNDIETWTNKGYGFLYQDTNRTNAFQYTDHILSAYGIYANAIKKFKYQAGIRFEQSIIESYQVTLDKRYQRDFFNFFPSVHLKYAISDEKEISLSYSKRINRPGNQQLNPYPDYSDRLNYRIGNPNLNPEYIDSYELSYGKFSRQLSYTATLFYRHTINNFYRIKTIDNTTGISTVTFANISQSHSTGVELTWNQVITKWFRINGNASAFHFLLEADEVYQTPESENFSWTARLSMNFTVTKTFDFQVTGNYRGPMVAPIGIIRPMGNVDFGCKKDFWNKKASLSFRISDIFNTQRIAIDGSYMNFYTDIEHKWESRTANLTFTYRINQGVEKKEKPRGGEGGGGDMGF